MRRLTLLLVFSVAFLASAASITSAFGSNDVNQAMQAFNDGFKAAIISGNESIVRGLMGCRFADALLIKEGPTLVELAIDNGHDDLVRTLLANFSIRDSGIAYRLAEKAAILGKNPAVLSFIAIRQDLNTFNIKFIMKAIKYGCINLLRVCLANHTAPLLPDGYIQWAAKGGAEYNELTGYLFPVSDLTQNDHGQVVTAPWELNQALDMAIRSASAEAVAAIIYEPSIFTAEMTLDQRLYALNRALKSLCTMGSPLSFSTAFTKFNDTADEHADQMALALQRPEFTYIRGLYYAQRVYVILTQIMKRIVGEILPPEVIAHASLLLTNN